MGKETKVKSNRMRETFFCICRREEGFLFACVFLLYTRGAIFQRLHLHRYMLVVMVKRERKSVEERDKSLVDSS